MVTRRILVSKKKEDQQQNDRQKAPGSRSKLIKIEDAKEETSSRVLHEST